MNRSYSTLYSSRIYSMSCCRSDRFFLTLGYIHTCTYMHMYITAAHVFVTAPALEWKSIQTLCQGQRSSRTRDSAPSAPHHPPHPPPPPPAGGHLLTYVRKRVVHAHNFLKWYFKKCLDSGAKKCGFIIWAS